MNNDNKLGMTRRSFLINTVKISSMFSLYQIACKVPFALSKVSIGVKNYVDIVKNIPPLFCVAYITPDIPEQAGQERSIARYPLVIVPQENRKVCRAWRDKIKAYNPKILMLAYQMVIEETTVPGPGHDLIRKAKDSWAVYPGNYYPTVGPKSKQRKIFDPRKPEWRKAFLDACCATLESYSYDGLFLDQCSVFIKAHPNPFVRSEMHDALQETLMELRKTFPEKLIVGNSRDKWAGLNGEMNEARFAEIKNEFKSFGGHVKPNIMLYLTYLKGRPNEDIIRKQMKLVHDSGGFFGACVNAQKVYWCDVFEEIVNQYKYR